MGAGAGQSLSWFCSAHNRSRLTWKFWKAVWGGRGWLWFPVGARTLTNKAPGKFFYSYCSVLLCFILFSCFFIIFYFLLFSCVCFMFSFDFFKDCFLFDLFFTFC